MGRRTLPGLIRATHPVPAAAVTLIVGGLLAARGAGSTKLWWAVASTAAGQASVGWSNDVLDRHRDRRAGRTEKPLVSGAGAPGAVWAAALVAGPLSVVLALPLGPRPALVMGAAVASAWLYNLGLKDTLFSAVPYAASFGLLPVFVWRVAGEVAPGWIVAGAALLGVAGHLTNAVPDLPTDTGRGLPQRLGAGRSLTLAAALLAGTLVMSLSAGGGWGEPPAAGLGGVAAGLIAGVVIAVRRGRARLGFYLTIAAAAAIAATAVAARP